MEIKFLGAARTVTGSCFLVSKGKTKFLIDCGLFQGPKELKELNYGLFDFDPAEIDFVLLTHAHIDHSGLIPKLSKLGFKGKIYCTTATQELCKIMLADSGHIQEMEVDRKNRKNIRSGKPLLEPIYTVMDANESLDHFTGVEYNKKITITPEISVCFRNSGHILGSAIIEVWLINDEKQVVKVVFSGDLGNFNQPIVKDPVFIDEADYLIVESTYGNRIREQKEEIKTQLLRIIKETMSAGGNLIIPAFAIERTQDLLYYLALLEQEGHLEGINIFVDSPLAISATEIFCNNEQYFDVNTLKLTKKTNDCPLIIPGLNFTKSAEESMKLNRIQSGAIIISASGMCDAGRIKHHLKHNLWRQEATILFVGYQAGGTLGRRILSGEKQVKIHGEDITVKAKIVNLDGVSSHADQLAILNWIKSMQIKPGRVFVTHGEEQSATELARIINLELKLDAVVPERLHVEELNVAGSGSRHAPGTILFIKEQLPLIKNELKQIFVNYPNVNELEHILLKLEEIESEIANIS